MGEDDLQFYRGLASRHAIRKIGSLAPEPGVSKPCRGWIVDAPEHWRRDSYFMIGTLTSRERHLLRARRLSDSMVPSAAVSVTV